MILISTDGPPNTHKIVQYECTGFRPKDRNTENQEHHAIFDRPPPRPKPATHRTTSNYRLGAADANTGEASSPTPCPSPSCPRGGAREHSPRTSFIVTAVSRRASRPASVCEHSVLLTFIYSTTRREHPRRCVAPSTASYPQTSEWVWPRPSSHVAHKQLLAISQRQAQEAAVL